MTIDVHGQPGHNSGKPAWQVDRDAAFDRAIETFTGEERIQEALMREAFLQMDSGERLVLLRNATLLGLARMCRMQPRMACDSALYVVITALSDNDRGVCWLSQRRLGQLLSRSPTTISEAITRLRRIGMIQYAPGDGENNQYWPVVHPSLQHTPAGVRWFIDRFSTPSQQVRAKAVKSLVDQTPKQNPSAVREGFQQNPPAPHGGLSGEPFGSTPQNPSAPRDPIYPKDNLPYVLEQKMEKKEEAQPKVVLNEVPGTKNGFRPRDDQYELYNRQYNSFGKNNSGLDQNPHRIVARAITDSDLTIVLMPHREVDPALLERCLDIVLAELQTKITGDGLEVTNRGRSSSFGQYSRYVSKSLRTTMSTERLAEHKINTEAALTTETAKVKLGKEQNIARQLEKAVDKSIQDTRARKLATPMAPTSRNGAKSQNWGPSVEIIEGPTGLLIFGSGKKFAAIEHKSISYSDANDVLKHVREKLSNPDEPGEDWLLEIVKNAHEETSSDPTGAKTIDDDDDEWSFTYGRLGARKVDIAIGKIKETWKSKAYAAAAVKMFGDREAQAGGKAASVTPSAGIGPKLLRAKWFVLSDTFIAKLRSECPDVDDRGVYDVFGDLKKIPVREEAYGKTLQSEVETKFSDLVKSRQAKIDRERAAKAEAAAKKAEDDRLAAEAGEKARIAREARVAKAAGETAPVQQQSKSVFPTTGSGKTPRLSMYERLAKKFAITPMEARQRFGSLGIDHFEALMAGQGSAQS